MSLTLSRIYTSAPTDDAQLALMQLSCAAWAAPIRLAVSARDEVVTLPGGEVATFRWSGLSVNFPDQQASGSGDLSFSIGGVTDEAFTAIDDAIAADAVVTATLYVYTQLNRAAPQKTPLTLEVTGIVNDGMSFQCAAQVRDIINSTFPRLRYTPDVAPGLKYYG
jgi:hypothetical protein